MKTVEKLLLVRAGILEPGFELEPFESAALAALLATSTEETYRVSPIAWNEEEGISHKVFRLKLTGLEEIQAARKAAVEVLHMCLINCEEGGLFTVNQLPTKHKTLDAALAAVGLKVNSLA